MAHGAQGVCAALATVPFLFPGAKLSGEGMEE